MANDQGVFAELFRNQVYAPPEDLTLRDWQLECLEAYQESRERWASSHQWNGCGEQHRFCLYAGTGAGKTIGVGLLAADMLNRKHISQIVMVVPNRAVKRKTATVFRRMFGIDLVAFNAKKHRAEGIGRTKQGYILTYSHVMQNPDLHKKLCACASTMVVFDEVHHLADRNEWGGKALEAFSDVPFVVTMTGTPWRTEGDAIPFVTYEPTDLEGVVRFSASPIKGTGFTYSLGRAISEGVCRKPVFVWHDGEVDIRTSADGPWMTVSFDTNLSPGLAALRLCGAVKHGSVPRKRMIEVALMRARLDCRKVIFFLGGDSKSPETATDDAKAYLPSELVELGIRPEEYMVITCDDPDAQEKLDSFGTSEAWILISINMVSEGNDIPQLSDAIFLSSIRSLQTSAQRIGRILRLMGDGDPHKDALVNMFADPVMKKFAAELDSDIDVWREIALNRRRKEGKGSGSGSDERRAEAIGVAGGDMCGMTVGGREFPIEVVRERERQLAKNNLPHTLIHIALSLILEEENVHSASI